MINWLITCIIYLSLICQAYAFKISDEFKYCETTENKAIWDLPESCKTPLIINTNEQKVFHIISKKTNEVSGKGWYCSKRLNKITTYKNVLGTTTEEMSYEYLDLTREDCLEMVRTKRCDDHNLINYSEEYGYSDNKPFVDYNWLQYTKYTWHTCKFYPKSIEAERANNKILLDLRTKSTCLANELSCKLKETILVWEPKL